MPIKVGTPVAGRPPRRSLRAVLIRYRSPFGQHSVPSDSASLRLPHRAPQEIAHLPGDYLLDGVRSLIASLLDQVSGKGKVWCWATGHELLLLDATGRRDLPLVYPQPRELLPAEASPLTATIEPLEDKPHHGCVISPCHSGVADHTVVVPVTPQSRA